MQERGEPRPDVGGRERTEGCRGRGERREHEFAITAFKRHLLDQGRPGNAAEARALLRYCEDVNPCNSGLGFGFNPTFPSVGGKALEHFTGPEYVLRNQPLNSVGAARIQLTAPR